MIDLLDAALNMLKKLSFGFNQAVVIFIEDQVGEKAAGFWLFLSHGKDTSCSWLGVTEQSASQALKHLYGENLKSIRSQDKAGMAIAMTELLRAVEGYADSLTRFEDLYRDLLHVDTPQEGLEKLEAKAKSAMSDGMIERLLAATFGSANQATNVSRRDSDLNDYRNASLHRP